MSGIQIVGNVNNTTAAEVETNTRAMRTVVRPDDWGSLGIYRVGITSGSSVAGTIMSAGLASSSPVFSYRNSTANPYIVKQVLMSVISASVGFTAGVGLFNFYVARSFSASDSGGLSILPSGNSNKLRTSMATTGLADLRMSSTATLTAGTRTLDTNPLSSIETGVGTGTFTSLVASNSVLVDQRVGEYPLVLAQNEGFVIQASVPATGVWQFTVSVSWEELSSY